MPRSDYDDDENGSLTSDESVPAPRVPSGYRSRAGSPVSLQARERIVATHVRQRRPSFEPEGLRNQPSKPIERFRALVNQVCVLKYQYKDLLFIVRIYYRS